MAKSSQAMKAVEQVCQMTSDPITLYSVTQTQQQLLSCLQDFREAIIEDATLKCTLASLHSAVTHCIERTASLLNSSGSSLVMQTSTTPTPVSAGGAPVDITSPPTNMLCQVGVKALRAVRPCTCNNDICTHPYHILSVCV